MMALSWYLRLESYSIHCYTQILGVSWKRLACVVIRQERLNAALSQFGDEEAGLHTVHGVLGSSSSAVSS